MQALHRKMARGVFWSLLEKSGEQFFSFVVFAIVTRFVGPEAYGLVNLCAVYAAFSLMVILGMADGIVNLHITDDARLSTLFWAIMGAGFALALAGILGATAFAAIMEQPALIPLMRLFAAVPLLMALSSVPTLLVLEKMDFRIFALRTLAASFFSGVGGIALAFLGFGAYALVWQQILLYAVINIVIWPRCGWTPRFQFDRAALYATLMPGLKMAGTSFVSFLEQQMPRLLIGGFLGPAAVGFYAMTTRIQQALRDTIGHPLTVVLYPAFSQIQKDPIAQKDMLGKLLLVTGILVFPALSGAALTAPLYVPLLFGNAWLPAVPVLQILLFSAIPTPFFVILRDFLRAQNQMGPYLKMQTVLVVATLIVAALLTPFGLVALSAGLVAMAAAGIPLHIFLLRRLTGIDLTKAFVRLGLPALATFVMLSAAYAFMRADAFSLHAVLRLIGTIGIGGGAYALGLVLLMAREGRHLIAFVHRLRTQG